MEAAIAAILANIQASSAGLIPIVYTLLIAAGLDVLSGVWAAYSSGSLDSKFIPEFINSHIVRKITPILLTLIAGISVGGTSSEAGLALVALGGTAGAAYLASVVASIRNNIVEGRAGIKGVPTSTVTVAFPTVPLTDVAEPDTSVPAAIPATPDTI